MGKRYGEERREKRKGKREGRKEVPEAEMAGQGVHRVHRLHNREVVAYQQRCIRGG